MRSAQCSTVNTIENNINNDETAGTWHNVAIGYRANQGNRQAHHHGHRRH